MSSAKFITVVLGVPVRADGKVLLSQRHAPQVPAVHHKWQVIGGGVEFGETPEQTLAREFQEETQLSVEILSPHPIVKTSVWTARQLEEEHSTHATLITYLIKVHPELPNWSSDPETADMQWFGLDEIAMLDTLPLTVEFVSEAIELFNTL